MDAVTDLFESIAAILDDTVEACNEGRTYIALPEHLYPHAELDCIIWCTDCNVWSNHKRLYRQAMEKATAIWNACRSTKWNWYYTSVKSIMVNENKLKDVCSRTVCSIVTHSKHCFHSAADLLFNFAKTQLFYGNCLGTIWNINVKNCKFKT